MKKIRVLIVEDSESDEKLLLLKLSRAGYEVESERVESAVQLKKALTKNVWDVILSDYEMPGFTGMDALRILKESKLDIPFIIVSGSIGEETAVQAMLAGVNDYLMKDNIARLVPAIEREIKSAANRRKEEIAENARKEIADRYQHLFEDANDAIYTIDLDGNYTSINKKGEELLGYSREEILQSNFCDYLDDETKQKVYELREKKKNGVISETRYELDIYHKNGGKKTVDVSSRLVYKDGKPFEIEGISRDITHQKKLLTDLSESEKRLSLALSAAKMGAWEWNFQNNEVFWSEECYSILQQKTFGGHLNDFLKIVHPDDVNGIWFKINQAIKDHNTFTAEYRILNSEGKIIWVFDQGIAEYNDDGTPLRCIGTFRNITVHKQLEQNLATSEARFRMLAENNVAGVTLGKADGSLLFVNDAYLNITGYSREDFENKQFKWSDLTPREYYEIDKKSIEYARQTGKSEQYEKEYIRKDGSRVPILIAYAKYEIDGEEYFISTVLDFTERKKAERELRESVEDFRALVEATSQIVWTITDGKADDNFLEVWCQLTGQTLNESEGWGWLNAIHPDDREPVRQLWEYSFSNNVPYNIVYRILTISGQYKYFAVRAVPVFHYNGELRKWFGAFSDITERKEIEEELRQSEARFKLAQDGAGIGTREWNLITNKSIWSDGLWAQLGVERDSIEAGYETYMSFILPEDRTDLENAFKQAIENNEFLDTEYRLRRDDGEILWINAKGTIFYDNEDKPLKMVGVTINITERKKIEENLRQSESRLQLSQKSAKIGTWEWNLATNETIWSDGVWMQFGLELESIKTNYDKYMDFVLPEDLKSLENALEISVESGDALDTEYRIRRKDGKIFWINAKGSVVYDKDGIAEKMVGVTIDITERKTVEESLQTSEEKLRQSQKLESVGRLAGGIAHDFNNMLTAINGYSDLILNRISNDDPYRGFISEIRKAGERSADLTHQLLAFSRQQILQPKVLNINQIIADTTVMLQRLIGEDVRLVEKFSSDIGKIKADPGQITQVIMNLAVNARDAMPNGGTLTVETENVYLDNDYVKENPDFNVGTYVLLKVHDTGVGMKEELLENIFEPFFTTKEIGTGTGLGLATVYGIINQSGGHINVKSIIDEGTTFEIFLPEVEEIVEKIDINSQNQNLLTGLETILIVEDEEIVRNLTAEVLRSYGYNIVEAKNGMDAIEICESGKQKFDLLLTDVVMPKMGGHELAEKLLLSNPKLRILFTSGYTQESKVDHEIMGAATNFIHKPFTPDLLALEVRKMLNPKKSV